MRALIDQSRTNPACPIPMILSRGGEFPTPHEELLPYPLMFVHSLSSPPALLFFFLKYAGGLHIIALREGELNQNSHK
jgi:hypothetical protein